MEGPPNRYNDSISEVEKWHLTEVTEHARLQPKYLQCRGNYILFSDDAHSLSGVGNAGILVDANTRNGKDILKAIKEGNFRLWASNLKGLLAGGCSKVETVEAAKEAEEKNAHNDPVLQG